MSNQDFNPYAPPETRHDDPSGQPLGSGEYRIEKNTLIVREPCRLPQVCFWSGGVSDLTDCEFKIRVMPRWWAFAMPILICCQQFLIIPMMAFIAPMFLPASGASPLFIGIMIGTGPGLLIVLFVGMMRYVGRIVTVNGSFNEQSVRKWRLKTQKVLLGLVVVIAGVFGAIWFLTGRRAQFIVGALFAVGIVLIVGLRFRKPWSHIVGSINKDGDIVISGLRPEFFRALSQSKTIAFQSDERM